MDGQRPELAQENLLDDRGLMARVQQDDEAALARLMERWEVPTKAVIGRIVLNASEAEDLAQETFVRVWEQRHRFHAGAEFRPWLFAIAVNLARNRLRWWRRRPVVSLQDWTRGVRAAGNDLPGPPDPPSGEPAASRALESNERAAVIRAAVAALPTELREAIVLFEYEQLSHAEIAAIVGSTTKAVETRIYRARQKLRSALADLRG